MTSTQKYGLALATPWQFTPEQYGAKGDGALLYDVSITSGTAVLTTTGLPAPAAPTLAQSSGGTVANGTYLIQITYVNQYGETLASTASSITTTGANGTITVTSPLPWTNATAYYVYCTQAGGGTGTETRQQALGSPTPLRTSFVISAPPSSGGTAATSLTNTSNSSPFTSGDVNKLVMIPDAVTGGTSTSPLVTTIQSYQSPTQVTLAANAGATVTSHGALYGTDDTSAVQSAINSAVAYAQTGSTKNGIGEVVFGNNIYCIGGSLTGSFQNAQITLPYVDSYVGAKVTLKLTGPMTASGGPHWEQPNPLTSGAVLASFYFSTSGSPPGTGQHPAPFPAVIGGPVSNFGGGGGLFSNMRCIVDGINILASFRSCINGLDLYGVAQAEIRSFSHSLTAIVTGAAAGGWPVYPNNKTNPSLWQTCGYRSPGLGNNAVNTCQHLVVLGTYHGLVYCDHFAAVNVVCLYNFYGATAASAGSTGQSHHCSFLSLCVEGCQSVLYCDASSTYGNKNGVVFVASLHYELANVLITDTSNLLFGEAHLEGATVNPGSFPTGKSGGSNFRIIYDYQNLGAVSSPPAVPASGTALTNGFWQNAVVTVTGGAVSAIAVDGQTTGLTSGQIYVRNGGTITLTYSSAPTWAWSIG